MAGQTPSSDLVLTEERDEEYGREALRESSGGTKDFAQFARKRSWFNTKLAGYLARDAYCFSDSARRMLTSGNAAAIGGSGESGRTSFALKKGRFEIFDQFRHDVRPLIS